MEKTRFITRTLPVHDRHRHSKLDVVADTVQFLARREDRAASDDVPAADLDDEDIPF